MRVLGYLRVSTEEQARSGLGLEAQRATISAEAERRGWHVQWIVDEGYSAKDLRRPGITGALQLLEDGGPDVLVVAKLDRLSRSLLDFAGLMDRARREGWALVALDLGVDTTTASGEMMASVMAAFAQYERRLIGQRTRDALAAKRQQGVRLGGPVALPEDVRQRIAAERRAGATYQQIADGLNASGVPTARGGTWHRATVWQTARSVALDQQATMCSREATSSSGGRAPAATGGHQPSPEPHRARSDVAPAEMTADQGPIQPTGWPLGLGDI